MMCRVEGCNKERSGQNSLCSGHLYRKNAWGDVRADLPIRDRGTRPVVGHPLYHTWKGIKGRTTVRGNSSWAYYGGRGITMHPAWLADATEFYRWVEDNLGPRPDGHTLDRIDNEGNYEPGNLRWATAQEQQANTRRTRHPLTDEQVARIEAAR